MPNLTISKAPIDPVISFKLNRISHTNKLDKSISVLRVVGLYFSSN